MSRVGSRDASRAPCTWFPPKPDWGERLRSLGWFAVLAILVWAFAGYPPLAGHDLRLLRDVVDEYWRTVIVWVVFVSLLSLLDDASPAEGNGPLAVPARFTKWVAWTLLIVVGLIGAGMATGFGISLGEGR